MNLVDLIDKTELFFNSYGYWTIFLGSLIEITPLGWLMPGGLIIAIAGFFANTGSEIFLVPIIITGTFGAWFTFLGAYLLGNKSGFWLVKKLKQEKNAEFAKSLLKKHGGAILTTSMMANLTRFWIAYIAGVEKYNFWKFFFYSGVASLSWVSIMAILGFLAGYERGNVEAIVGATGIIGWLFLGIASFVLGRSIKHEYKHFKEDTPHNENS
ncbi:MAG: DedA family protein [Microgenomates group bacterium]